MFSSHIHKAPFIDKKAHPNSAISSQQKMVLNDENVLRFLDFAAQGLPCWTVDVWKTTLEKQGLDKFQRRCEMAEIRHRFILTQTSQLQLSESSMGF